MIAPEWWLFLILIIVLYLILWIALPKGPARIVATQIAEERYARGELSAAEFERLRTDLQAAR